MKQVSISVKIFFSMAAVIAIMAGCSLGLAQTNSLKLDPTFESWRKKQIQVSTDKIFEALSQPDAVPGVVIASPSKSYPDYYYHWVRDAGLVMDLVVDLYEKKNTSYSQQYITQKMNDYISFSKKNQLEQTLTGLGEPKFYVDGSAYGLSWGRPQTDGPALRALTLIRWAHIKLDEGQTTYVKQNLYNNDFNSLIKADLEYVSHNWKLPTFDLWEEVKADHFFTSMVQLAALNEGAKLAQRVNDVGASDWYLRQAAAITSHLQVYMNSSYAFIPVSMNYVDGFHTKYSGLDIAVILAILRTPERNAFVSVENYLVQKTLSVLISEFQKIYSINHASNVPGVAIGRYPEDVYDGVGMSRANPWVLATMAVAESYYKLSIIRSQQGSFAQAEELFELADQFYHRVQAHANPDHSLSEQMDRHSGYMVGARDLTWSHASVLKAEWAREKALQKFQQ